MKLFRFIQEFITQTWHFVDAQIWEKSKSTVKDRVIMTIYIAAKRFDGDKLLIKSAALTFSTMLAVVPLFALLFAVVKGFGFANLLESELFRTLPIDRESLNQSLQFIDNYLSQTKDGVFIGTGLVLLLVTIWGLISTIEDVFNDIWEVKRLRSYTRRFTDYFSFLFIVPFLLIVTSGLSLFITTMFGRLAEYQLISPLITLSVKFTPTLLSCILFTSIYILIPNTKVKFTTAVVSGLIAGVAFNLFQVLYINGQIWVTRYSAIYGSFAALPLLMLWIQVSWLICLMGAEVAFAGQNIENLKEEMRYLKGRVCRLDKDFLVLLLCSLIVKRMVKGKEPYTATQLASECLVPVRLTRQTLNELIRAKIIKDCQVEDSKEMCYIPYIDPNRLSVGYLFERFESAGAQTLFFRTNEKYENIRNYYTLLKQNDWKQASTELLKDL